MSGGQQQRVALARALVNRPACAAARRAARRARPAPAQAAADRAQPHPARGRDHLRPRHARPGGGDDDGRHDRRDARRPDRPARSAHRALRPPAHGVRRQLPRLVEPDRRHARSGATARRRRVRGRRRARLRVAGRARSRPPATARAHRRAAGEDLAAAGRRGAPAGQRAQRAARPRDGRQLPRRLDAVRRPHRWRGGHPGVRPERRLGARDLGPGRRVAAIWDPEHTFVVARGKTRS